MKKDTHTGLLFGGSDQPLEQGCEKCGRSSSAPAFGCTGAHPVPLTAESARNEALERVVENAGDDFAAQVWTVIRAMPIGTKFIGEELRLRCLAHGVEKPHHHNAWGGVMARLPSSPLLEKTGVRRKMQTTKSHARETAEYVRVGRRIS